MTISDTITLPQYMSCVGIVVSISKTDNCPPAKVFTGLAHRAAKTTSRRLGVHVEFSGDSLEVVEEHVPASLVLKQFREALLHAAKEAAGID